MKTIMKQITIPTHGKNQACAPQISLPPALVAVAILGHDISTFKGWTAAVDALLSMMPAGAAMIDGSCMVYRADGQLWEVFASSADSNALRVDDRGCPVEYGECDAAAFCDEQGCWEGYLDNPAAGREAVTSPRFVQLQLVTTPSSC